MKRNALKSDGKNATMKTFFRDCFKVMMKTMRHVHHASKTKEKTKQRRCKLITCQQNNLQNRDDKKTIFSDMDLDLLGRNQVTQSQRLRLIVCYLVSSSSADWTLNKTNDKDNWVWKIKNYRYDVEWVVGWCIKYLLLCKMHFSCCFRFMLLSISKTLQNEFKILMTK